MDSRFILIFASCLFLALFLGWIALYPKCPLCRKKLLYRGAKTTGIGILYCVCGFKQLVEL